MLDHYTNNPRKSQQQIAPAEPYFCGGRGTLRPDGRLPADRRPAFSAKRRHGAPAAEPSAGSRLNRALLPAPTERATVQARRHGRAGAPFRIAFRLLRRAGTHTPAGIARPEIGCLTISPRFSAFRRFSAHRQTPARRGPAPAGWRRCYSWVTVGKSSTDCGSASRLSDTVMMTLMSRVISSSLCSNMPRPSRSLTPILRIPSMYISEIS